MEKNLTSLFDDYASYHRTSGNQATHAVGIPLIVLAVLGLLGNLPLMVPFSADGLIRLDAGGVVWFLGVFWYLRQDWRLAVPFAPVLLAFYLVGRVIPPLGLGACFVLGWAIQYFGHYAYEKKAPAFYKNAQHLLIGPFWIFAKWTGYRLAP